MGWDGMGCGQTSEYDIRSVGRVKPDDEHTRGMLHSRASSNIPPTVRDRRLRQVQQTGIVVR